jgi:hypothetical protein
MYLCAYLTAKGQLQSKHEQKEEEETSIYTHKQRNNKATCVTWTIIKIKQVQ